MPTYEFTCPEGHDFDKFFRSMASAPTVVPCPVCGKPAERQMSAGAGLVFHGTGFYITDYGKDGKKDQKSAARRSTESKGDQGADAAASRSDASGSSSDAATAPPASPDAKPAADGTAKVADAPAKPKTPPKAAE